MNIIVTGGAGFIGSHLCESLVELGDKVICIDNFLTGNRKNIDELQEKPGFRFIEHDACQPWPELSFKPDLIYHLASPASPVDYSKYALETMFVNSAGTKNALEVATAAEARLVLASTSEVYGDPKVSPQTEGYWGNVNPIGPRSCYDESKRFAEALAKTYWRKLGTKVTIVRIFNTFGPRMREKDGRVVPNFINQALAGEPLTIYGDGSQTRSFCYVSDMVTALVKVGRAEDTVDEVINLGNPQEMTILELADAVRDIFDKDLELSFCELPEDDPMQRRPDISKSKSMLGWEPVVGLKEGLRATANWFSAKGAAK